MRTIRDANKSMKRIFAKEWGSWPTLTAPVFADNARQEVLAYHLDDVLHLATSDSLPKSTRLAAAGLAHRLLCDLVEARNK